MRKKTWVLLLIMAVILVTGPIQGFASDAQPYSPNVYIRESSCKGDGVTSLAWSPNGNVLAIGDREGIHLYSGGFEPIGLLTGNSEVLTVLEWSPDGNLIAGASLRDSNIWVWNIEQGEVITTFSHHDRSIQALAWNPNKLIIASGTDNFGKKDEVLYVWDAMTGEILQSFSTPPFGLVSAMDWNTDGSQLLFANYADAETSGIYGWNPTSDEISRVISANNVYKTIVAVSPNDRLIAVESTITWEGGYHIALEIRDIATEEPVRQFVSYDSHLATVTWHPTDSTLLAANSGDNKVRIWSLQQTEPVAILDSGISAKSAILPYTDSLAWRPDGTQLAEAGCDGFVRVWDTTNYDLMTMFEVSPSEAED